MGRLQVILPTKGISTQRALVTIGAQVLETLSSPRTVNSTYERLQQLRLNRGLREPVSFDWFSLSLAMLYTLSVVQLSDGGLLTKVRQ